LSQWVCSFPLDKGRLGDSSTKLKTRAVFSPQQYKSRYALLGMLSLQPMSGYDLKKFTEWGTANFWQENYAQIYPMLRQLTACSIKGNPVLSLVEGVRAILICDCLMAARSMPVPALSTSKPFKRLRPA